MVLSSLVQMESRVSLLSKVAVHFTPVRQAVIGSLLLSLAAVLGTDTVARDATLYFDAAQSFLDGGLQGSLQYFDWPWFSILLALTHAVTGVTYELAGYIWCAVFMAGICGLLVSLSQRYCPGAGTLAVLVVLAIPGFNQYRGEVLREFGFWFFCLLALRLADAWRGGGGWRLAILAQLAVLAGAAFRLETIFLIPVLAAWQWLNWTRTGGVKGLLQINALAWVGMMLALALASSNADLLARPEKYLSLIDPSQIHASFDLLAGHLAAGMPFKYSKDDAGLILFIGLLGVLITGFLSSMGAVAVPLLVSGKSAVRRLSGGCAQQIALAWGGYFIVLLAFILSYQFMVARYLGLLSILATPLAVGAVYAFKDRYQRLGLVLVIALVISVLDNVISLGAGKAHLKEAGHWMATHVPAGESVYYEDVRISYYAGRGARRQPLSREQAMSEENAGSYRYFFIKSVGTEPWLREWQRLHSRNSMARFSNGAGDSIVVLGPELPKTISPSQEAFAE